MKVISFVPSWTETLLEAGIDVVGRTRFCIHPQARVKNIAVVGGTKDANWAKVQELKPELIIFDREENTRDMAETCGFPFYATHVTSVPSLAKELAQLSKIFSNKKLHEFSERARFCPVERSMGARNFFEPLTAIPEKIETVLYMIWKNPWMAVSRDTFIGSVCELLGCHLPQFSHQYPKINLDDYDPKTTLLLFSSEPFPFRRHRQEIASLGFPAAVVEGESFSWFGLRSIRFLEEQFNHHSSI